jgi:DNA-binding response OmpR family regulator
MAKILLADDHRDIVRLLEMALGREHTILRAYDGAEALRLARDEHPDIAILDVAMPELDGLRVLSRIKTDPELHDICVVMLTVRDQPEDVTLGLDVGADFYLSKPFKPGDVAALVERVVANRAEAETSSP